MAFSLTLRYLGIACSIVIAACSATTPVPEGETEDQENSFWLVQCESSLKPRVAPGEAPETAVAKGWIAARTPDDYEIRIRGHLDDGFLQVTEVHSDDPNWALDPSRPYAQLRAACRRTLANRRDGQLYRPGLVRTSHSVSGVYTSLVFDDWSDREHITRLSIFGDSLSDTGSLRRRLKVAPRKPYWVGRFANGPVWTDYLEVYADLAVQNHARGGAMATQREPMEREELVQRLYTNGQFFLSGSITHQIGGYAEHYLAGSEITRSDSSVAVLWAGANDYISKEAFDSSISLLLSAPFSEDGYRGVVSKVSQALEANLIQLRELGMTRFLVINLPDLGLTPMVLHNDSFMISRDYADDQARLIEFSTRLSELTQWHNQSLSAMVDRFRENSPGVEVLLLEASTVFDQVTDPMIGGEEMGFDLESNKVVVSAGGQQLAIQDRCYSGMTLGVFAPSANVCNEAARTVFWDLVHPTTYFHCWMAFYIGNRLHEEGWIESVTSMAEHRAWCEMIADAY